MPVKKRSHRRKSHTYTRKKTPSMTPFQKYILNELGKVDNFEDLFEIPREILEKKRCNSRGVKILITNTPCNGFGDLIFAWKLSKLLKYYYKVDVKIATTLAKGLLTLGADPKDVYRLASKKNPSASTRLQCRRYGALGIYEVDSNKTVDTEQFDLFFDAPLMADFEPDLPGLKKMIPKANYFNTFFFSEYNDELDKGFDFDTGVGEDRDGLIFLPSILNKISPKSEINSLVQTRKYGPFALAYIADIEDWQPCIEDFAEMIAAKYKYPKMQMICPSFTAETFINEDIAYQVFGKYYDKVIVVHKSKDKIIEKTIKLNNGNKTFYVRGDILPVPNVKMLGLIKYSIKDILLTGDQSITDALSCCARKNIFYQIAPWKENLGHQLAKLMPQKYLLKRDTACGTLKALKYNANYHKFVTKWNFMKRAGPRLNGIICMTALVKVNNRDGIFLKKYMSIVEKSRSVSNVETKMAD
jgi:hypothetical protein